jgi:hypothetical protein
MLRFYKNQQPETKTSTGKVQLGTGKIITFTPLFEPVVENKALKEKSGMNRVQRASS